MLNFFQVFINCYLDHCSMLSQSFHVVIVRLQGALIRNYKSSKFQIHSIKELIISSKKLDYHNKICALLPKRSFKGSHSQHLVYSSALPRVRFWCIFPANRRLFGPFITLKPNFRYFTGKTDEQAKCLHLIHLI